MVPLGAPGDVLQEGERWWTPMGDHWLGWRKELWGVWGHPWVLGGVEKGVVGGPGESMGDGAIGCTWGCSIARRTLGDTKGHPWVLILPAIDGHLAWAWVDLEPPRNTQGS